MRSVWQVECEALPGLEELLGQEIQRRLGAGSLRFRFSRPLAELLQLRLAHGVHRFREGIYRDGGTTIVVTRGLGTTLVPFRVAARPEVSLLRLRPA